MKMFGLLLFISMLGMRDNALATHCSGPISFPSVLETLSETFTIDGS